MCSTTLGAMTTRQLLFNSLTLTSAWNQMTLKFYKTLLSHSTEAPWQSSQGMRIEPHSFKQRLENASLPAEPSSDTLPQSLTAAKTSGYKTFQCGTTLSVMKTFYRSGMELLFKHAAWSKILQISPMVAISLLRLAEEIWLSANVSDEFFGLLPFMKDLVTI